MYTQDVSNLIKFPNKVYLHKVYETEIQSINRNRTVLLKHECENHYYEVNYMSKTCNLHFLAGTKTIRRVLETTSDHQIALIC